jgi:hypothetical protein
VTGLAGRLAPLERVALAVAIGLPVALRQTRFHAVPTSGGTWSGLSDPPTAGALAVGLAVALAAFLVLKGPRARAARPLLVLLTAALPIVSAWTGHATALLLFQGPVLVILGIAAATAAVANAASQRNTPHTPRGLLFGAALAFYVALGLRIPGPAGPQGDEPHFLLMTQSLLSDHDLDLTDELAQREYAGFYAGRLDPHISPASPPGRLYSVHSPGLSALLLPAYAVGGYPAAKLFLSALAALTGVLVHALVLAIGGSPQLALGCWAALVFTPPLPFYALAVYPETPAALATAAFLLWAQRDPKPRQVLLAGVLAAGLPWLHPKFLPLAALGLGFVIVRKGPRWARATALLTFAAGVAALLALFARLYGQPALSAAYGPTFPSYVTPLQIPRGLAGLLLDRQFGLLAVGPVFALAGPGLALLLRQRVGDGLRAGVLAAVVLGVGASFDMWWGGACPPARFVIPALPALAAAFAPAFAVRRTVAASLAGLGLGVVAIAAEAPRALHNRADGASGLLGIVAPALDLDGALPSFVVGGAEAGILAVTLLAALACAWRFGARGLLAGALAFVALGAGLRREPLLDARRASLELLAAFDRDNLVGRAGAPRPQELSIDLEMPEAPWALDSSELRSTRRLDVPPGAYRLEADWRVLEPPASARIDLVAGRLALGSLSLEAASGTSSAEVTLPVGARRVQGWAAGLDGRLSLSHLRLVPIAVVPRRERAALPWMRAPEPDRYRIGGGAVKSTAVDRSEPDGSGFRISGSEGAFVVDAPAGTSVLVRLQRPTPARGDAVVWDGDRVALDARRELGVVLPAARGSRLGVRVAVPVRVRSEGAWVAFETFPGGPIRPGVD